MDSKQNFLEAALAVGLDCELIKPDDVLRHIPPEVLAANLPGESKTLLLAASLREGKMDANLVFETLDVRVFAENMPRHLLWACIAEAAKKALSDRSTSSRPAVRSTASKPSSKSSTVLSDVKARRRPNISRRPARLSQSRTARSTGELELDSDIGGRWASTSTASSPRDTSPSPSPQTPSTPPATPEQPFNEWVEETVTGDALGRRNKS